MHNNCRILSPLCSLNSKRETSNCSKRIMALLPKALHHLHTLHEGVSSTIRSVDGPLCCFLSSPCSQRRAHVWSLVWFYKPKIFQVYINLSFLSCILSALPQECELLLQLGDYNYYLNLMTSQLLRPRLLYLAQHLAWRQRSSHKS